MAKEGDFVGFFKDLEEDQKTSETSRQESEREEREFPGKFHQVAETVIFPVLDVAAGDSVGPSYTARVFDGLKYDNELSLVISVQVPASSERRWSITREFRLVFKPAESGGRVSVYLKDGEKNFDNVDVPLDEIDSGRVGDLVSEFLVKLRGRSES